MRANGDGSSPFRRNTAPRAAPATCSMPSSLTCRSRVAVGATRACVASNTGISSASAVDRDAGSLGLGGELRHIETPRIDDHAFGEQHDRLGTRQILEPHNQRFQCGQRTPRLHVRVLRDAARLLLELLRTRIAPAPGIVGRARGVDVVRQRAPALAKHGIGEPGASAIGNLQRFTDPEVELAGQQVAVADQ